MCGRFTITHPNEALAALFDAVPGNDLPPVPNFNVCPTNPVASSPRMAGSGGCVRCAGASSRLVQGAERRAADHQRAVGHGGDEARLQGRVRERRCIVPASGFYEWSEGEKGAAALVFHPADGLPMALAGVWQRWGDMDTVAIVSTEAGPGMAEIHHREPVVLERADWPLWLGEAGMARRC
jgi:putative SOS response-associated peptidase YedK